MNLIFQLPKTKNMPSAFSGIWTLLQTVVNSFQVGTENQSGLYIDDQLVLDHRLPDNRARIVWDDFDPELGLKARKHKVVLTATTAITIGIISMGNFILCAT